MSIFVDKNIIHMAKQCKTCMSWKPVLGAEINPDSFGNCQKIINGSDVRISGYKLQTSASFSCKYFKGSETPPTK